MSTAEQALAPRLGAATFKSVPDMWHHRCHSTPSGDAMIHRDPASGEWVTLSWREAEERVRALANGLLSLGLKPEERCVLLSETRVEWILADLAILCAGGATTTLFPSSTAEECAFVAADCEPVVLFCDTPEQVEKLQSVRDRLPSVRQVVLLTEARPSDDGWVQPLSWLAEQGRGHAEAHPDAYAEAHGAIDPDSLATLMYTSGTTGEPKGVMLTHRSWVYEAAAIDALGLVSPADLQYLFLPLAHVFAKVLEVIFIRLGVPTVVDGDPKRLLQNLRETQPTWMAAVPRTFERAYAGIQQRSRGSKALQARVFDWAMEVGREVSRLRQEGREPAGLLKLRHTMADRLVLAKIRDLFGGRLRFFISGGAPLSPDLAESFHAFDLLILEGYGLTETSAATTFNTPEDFVFGTVGRPLPGTRLRIAEDGEILVAGPGVMRGYHNRPEADEQTFVTDEDDVRWLRTGDIGALLPTGHLRITGRKKEMIVTASGKNIAPARFQRLLVARCPYAAQVLVHGDRRPYLVALVTLDPETVGAWARSHDLEEPGDFEDPGALAALPEVRALVQACVDEVNETLPSHEMVRKIAVLPETWTVEDGSLTPTLKIKRRVVEERYAGILDAFYESPDQR